MKTILGILVALSVSASVSAREITCVGDKVNQQGAVYDANARFVLRIQDVEGQAIVSKLIGHVTVMGNADWAGEDRARAFDYYSVFNLKDLKSNLKYKPKKYKNHYQIKKVDTGISSSTDGGGMWGNLVINKDVLTKNVGDAHYIFQSGDHMGGTLRLHCAAYY